MKRFVTFYRNNPEKIEKIEVLEENEFTTNSTFEEWVWQFAENKEHALLQHDEKFALWQYDSEQGNAIRETY